MGKKYNPFKMWGSYVGGIFITILPSIIDNGISASLYTLFQDITFSQVLILFPVGFLVGWGIHSIIRRFKK